MWTRACLPLAHRDFAESKVARRLILLGSGAGVVVAAFQPSMDFDVVLASWRASVANGLAPPTLDAPYVLAGARARAKGKGEGRGARARARARAWRASRAPTKALQLYLTAR